MWKASARSNGRNSSEGKMDEQRDGGAAPQLGNNGQLLIGKELLDSIASHGLGPTIVEEKQGFFKGGKFLKALMRNFHVSSRSRSSSKTSSDEHSSVDDTNGNGRTNGLTQAEEILLVRPEASSVYQLQEELQTLRQRLDKEQEEMQKLRNEVSLLRLAGSNGNAQRQSHTQAGSHVDSGSLVGRNDSIRSDASQLSCLDFSLAPTGMLKFEGELRAKITPLSQPQLGSRDPMDSFLADAAAVSPVRTENSSKGNKVGHLLDVQSAAKSNTLIMIHKHEYVEEQVDDTVKKNLDGCQEKSCEPDYVEKHCHDHMHTGADLKFVESIKKSTDVQMSIPSCISDAEKLVFSTRADHEGQVIENSNSSRSPPKSICSTEEQDMTAFSSFGQKADSDLDDSLVLRKAAPFKESNGNSETADPKSPGVAANLKLVKKFSVMEMPYQDPEEETLKSHAHTIFKPPVESSIDWSSVTEETMLEEIGKNSISRSQGAASRAREARLQGPRLLLNMTADSNTSPGRVTSSAESESLSKAQSRLTAAYSLATEETPRKKVSSNNRFSSRRSRTQVVELGVVSEPVKGTSEFSRVAGAAFSGSTELGSRYASLDLDRSLDQESSGEEKWYPELELENFPKPMQSHRGEKILTYLNALDPMSRSAPASPRRKTLTNLNELDLVSRSAPGSPRRPVVGAELPRRSLDSQAMAESFSDQSRAVLRPWNINYKGDVQSKAISRPHIDREPMAGRTISDGENLQLRESGTYSGSVSSRYNATEVSDSPLVGPGHDRFCASSRYNATEVSDSPLVGRGHDRFSQSWSSPSRSSRARGSSPLRKSESKSGRGDLIWQTPSSDFTTVRSAGVEELNIEEEVRRCLEQSRKLLHSDVTTRCTNSSIEDDPSSEGGSRLLEKSFSVLTLSRRRRNMESNRSVMQNKQNQERQEPILYEDQKFNQSSNVDNGRVEAKEEDDYSIVISPRRLREAVASWDSKKRETRENNRQSISPQPVGSWDDKKRETRENNHQSISPQTVGSWDDKKRETRENNHQSVSPQPVLRSQRSRSRFYLEANAASLRTTISSPISTDLYRIS